MTNPPSSGQLSRSDANRVKRRRVEKAMLAGARFGAIVSGLPLVFFLIGRLGDARFRFDGLPTRPAATDVWQWIGWPIAQTLLVLLGCCALSAIMFGLAAWLSRESLEEQSADLFEKREREMKRREIRSKSVLALGMVGLFAMSAGLMLVVRGGILFASASGSVGRYAAGASLVVAGVAVLVGLRYLATAVLRRLPQGRDPRPSRAFDRAAVERPFDERLAQYIEQQPTAAIDSGHGSRWSRAFFLAIAPGARHDPKPQSVIRRILLRIHRLLGSE